uniref:Uncharacterized protein n=1 Tax=Cacopsylla melanoneura TaxID=428564 RepID=A0A8D9EIP9_9HEMI
MGIYETPFLFNKEHDLYLRSLKGGEGVQGEEEGGEGFQILSTFLYSLFTLKSDCGVAHFVYVCAITPSISMVWCTHKKHCSGVNPLAMPSQPFAGRFYLYASTSCYDSTSTKYRYGLFNNKQTKCEVIDFYSEENRD